MTSATDKPHTTDQGDQLADYDVYFVHGGWVTVEGAASERAAIERAIDAGRDAGWRGRKLAIEEIRRR